MHLLITSNLVWQPSVASSEGNVCVFSTVTQFYITIWDVIWSVRGFIKLPTCFKHELKWHLWDCYFSTGPCCPLCIDIVVLVTGEGEVPGSKGDIRENVRLTFFFLCALVSVVGPRKFSLELNISNKKTFLGSNSLNTENRDQRNHIADRALTLHMANTSLIPGTTYGLPALPEPE